MKRGIALLLICALALLTGCGSQKEMAAVSDQSDFTWQIELREHEIAEELHTDEGVKQYDGGVLDVAYDDAPGEGNVYLILTLTIAKTRPGGGAFDWAKLTVWDAEGARYARMENDSFLSTHSYKRMPGTALQIGENRGSICFEIPKAAADGALALHYDAGDEGENVVPIQ